MLDHVTIIVSDFDRSNRFSQQAPQARRTRPPASSPRANGRRAELVFGRR
jgi:catechol 2,3-dioxygenase-like lactoylglutathione lyase family enzyme